MIHSVDRRNRNTLAHVEFLYECYTDGLLLDEGSLDILRLAGYIELKHDIHLSFAKGGFFPDQSKKYINVPVKLPDDPNVDIIFEDTEKFVAQGVSLGRKIIRSDWAPKSLIYHKQDFVDWVDSINKGFQNRINYTLFELYKQQADEWYAENIDVMEEGDGAKQYDLMMLELERGSENSLYALNKYYFYQDQTKPGGQSKYFATKYYEHQIILSYLFDCGYSSLDGKPRQFGGTTMYGMLSVNRLLSRPNYFIKFITEDDKKGKEIFEDKIKFAFYSLPSWYIPQTNGKPDVLNDRDNFFKLGRKENKGKTVGLNSKMSVVPPTRTAINGGTPPLVLIDEIGSIDIISEMMNEGRPTMFKRDPVTGKMDLVNQVIGWGTGTSSKGGAAFEKEFRKALSAWKAGDYSYGFIPLFFDWTTRCDETEYLSQKRYYYGVRAKDEGIDAETSRIQFHQHFPTFIEDMFSTTQKLLVSRDLIEKNLKKIDNADDLHKSEFGFFEPIYDKNKPLSNPNIPFKIVGSTFTTTEEDDPRVTTTMFHRPKSNWTHRYYAGTDPISSDTGVSNMTTTIYDKHWNTASALVNFRTQNDPSYVFLQCTLACLYYDPIHNIGVPELIEKNIGLAYKQYKENANLHVNMLYETELPVSLRSSGGGSNVGVDNHGHRNRAIINYMAEVYNIYGDHLYIRDYWIQLRTFACSITKTGLEVWGSIDKRYYKDDAAYSLAYAYIAAQSNFNIPRSIEEESKNIRAKYELVYDKNFNQIRKPIVQHVESNN